MLLIYCSDSWKSALGVSEAVFPHFDLIWLLADDWQYFNQYMSVYIPSPWAPRLTLVFSAKYEKRSRQTFIYLLSFVRWIESWYVLATVATNKLQAIFATTLLRRKKDSMLDGKRLIELPDKTVELLKLEFSQEERAIYKMASRASAFWSRKNAHVRLPDRGTFSGNV